MTGPQSASSVLLTSKLEINGYSMQKTQRTIASFFKPGAPTVATLSPSGAVPPKEASMATEERLKVRLRARMCTCRAPTCRVPTCHVRACGRHGCTAATCMCACASIGGVRCCEGRRQSVEREYAVADLVPRQEATARSRRSSSRHHGGRCCLSSHACEAARDRDSVSEETRTTRRRNAVRRDEAGLPLRIRLLLRLEDV
jgi:hypothetical protein